MSEKNSWKLYQVFGEDPQSATQQNSITSLEFDKSGNYLGVGYQCGQVVVFKRTDNTGDNYKLFAQFESHHPEFDFLTSLEIEEKINQMRWIPFSLPNDSKLILTTNDKTIKLWKLTERSGEIKSTKRKVYANAHAYNINSISLCSDGELFLSADDLRINIWNIERNNECFTIIDSKPTNMNELTEVITSAAFHPIEGNVFVYSSSKGMVRMGDMRQKALCDTTLKSFKTNSESKSFFADVIASIGDIKYSHDGKYVMARDYMNIKLWDIRMDSEPFKIIKVHEHIRSHLYELYENDGIFDKFEANFTYDDSNIITGSYTNNFGIWNLEKGNSFYFQTLDPRDTRRKPVAPTVENISFSEKVQHLATHPKSNIAALAAQNYLFLYHVIETNNVN